MTMTKKTDAQIVSESRWEGEGGAVPEKDDDDDALKVDSSVTVDEE